MTDANSLYTTAIATIGAVLTEFYTHLAPWLLFGAVLVFVDLRFGLMAARKRGDDIRPSRAVRRTINKMIDYLCWVTMAEVCSMTFDVIFGVPVVTIAILIIIYGIELNSCVNNYLEYKGVKKRLNFFKLVGRENLLENEVNNNETEKP